MRARSLCALTRVKGCQTLNKNVCTLSESHASALPRCGSLRAVSWRGVNAVLTVSLCTDEAGGGAVKEGEEAGNSQADVGVGRPQVQSGEAGELNLQDVLWSHLDIGHLHRDISHSFFQV